MHGAGEEPSWRRLTDSKAKSVHAFPCKMSWLLLEMKEERPRHLQLAVGCVSHPAVKPHGSAQPFSAWMDSDLPAARLQTLHKPHKSYIYLV